MFGEIGKNQIGKSSDFLIHQRRKEEFVRRDMLSTVEYYAKTSQKSEFEHNTNVINRNHVNRFIERKKQDELEELERRREKLKKLYNQEQEQWRHDLSNITVTQEERLEKMKARAAELKAKREEERRTVVEEKKLQQLRSNCDELRSLQSKEIEKEVAEGRKEQLHEKLLAKLSLEEENNYYDDLWETERLKKFEREEKVMQQKRLMDSQTLKVLQEQILLLQEMRAREEQLKQEETKILLEEIELQRLNEQRIARQKIEVQRQMRLELDAFNRQKIEQRAREIQDALAEDIKMINEFFKLKDEEKQEQSRKKEELRKELKAYYEYLLEQQRIENERQKEIDLIYREEEEKVWRQRAERWSREVKARHKLMAEVISTREEQLRWKYEKNQQEQAENLREKIELQKQIEASKMQENAEADSKRKARFSYKQALKEQMESIAERRRQQEELQKLEYENRQAVEVKYDKWLQEELKNPVLRKKSYGIKSYLTKP